MKVSEIMTVGAVTCGQSNNLAQATEIMWKNDCGIVPILDDRKRVLGVVTDRDLAVALGTRNRRADELRIDEVMSKPVHTCLYDDDVKQALALMHTHKVRRLPVIGRDGEFRGLLSIDDLFRSATSSGELSFASLASVMKRLSERGPSGAARAA